MNNTVKKLSRKVASNQQGLGLLELVIALALLGMTLALAYTFYFFGLATFNIGEVQADVQQNGRMAASFIVRELRIAERVIIVDDQSDLENLDIEASEDYDVFYIYLDNGSIYFQEVAEGGDTSAILEGISSKIDFQLNFVAGDTGENMIKFVLSAEDLETGRSFDLESENLVLNLEEIEDQSTGGGTAVLYQVPAPPDPAIRSVTIFPHAHDFGVHDDGDYVTIEVHVETNNVEDGSLVSAEFWRVLQDGIYDVVGIENYYLDPATNEIANDQADFLVKLKDENLNYGEYYIEVKVENTGFPQRRFYYINPVIGITIVDRPGEPFFGEVRVDTEGVPEGTEALVEIYYPEEDRLLEEGGEVTFHQLGDSEVDIDGVIEFSIKIEDSILLNKDLILWITIGKTTATSEEFDIVNEEEE